MEGFVWRELREFAFKGSAVDLAIGIVIGASFSKIVKVSASTLAAAGEQGAVLAYGGLIIGFLILAVFLFQLIKLSNRMKRQAPPADFDGSREAP